MTLFFIQDDDDNDSNGLRKTVKQIGLLLLVTFITMHYCHCLKIGLVKKGRASATTDNDIETSEYS